MKAIVTKENFQNCPQILLDIGYTNNSQLLIKAGNEYIIWAIVRWSEVFFFLVISDCNIPMWYPSWLFQLSDSKLPSDWICNFFDATSSKIEMLIGPDFIASDINSYTEMVEQTPRMMERFMNYVSEGK